MAISAAEYQRRLQPVLNSNVLGGMVEEIVMGDTALKREKLDELTKGENPDGSIIGEYRNAEYAFFKHHINPIAKGNVDLLLTRSFYNQMYLQKYGQRGFLFNSRDDKTLMLMDKYGGQIMSISQEWFNKRQKELYSMVLAQQIKQKYRIS